MLVFVVGVDVFEVGDDLLFLQLDAHVYQNGLETQLADLVRFVYGDTELLLQL